MLLEEYINVINAIRSYVNGEEMDQAFCSNLAGAYQICKKHNLTALMAEVLDRTDVDKRSPIYQRWQMEKNQAVYKNVLMDVEREEIIAFFEEKNIWYLLLKGLIIREYYPNPALREMSDNDILVDRKYMKDIYDFMVGREASVLCFCDGTHIKPMTSAQDHKRAKDGDQGLNTGGMGTFSPSPFYTPEIQKFCEEQIYQPTMDAMKAEGRDFVGILFVGLMMTQDGPKVLEYDARFGDPEAQVVLPRMKNDIIDVMEACIDGKLDQVDLQFEDNAAVCVVLASDGYPEHYEKGKKITFLKDFASEDGYYAFHAGTKLTEDGLVTNGGRVLGITAKGATLKEARKNAYKATEWVTFDNKYMRNDIGKAIDEI